jgi:hypothetical protein
LADLRRLRGQGRSSWAATLEQSVSAAEILGERLVAWIQTPDWDASEAYLQGEAADLLTDDAETALDMLQAANPGQEAIVMHFGLLQACREHGIAAA